MLKVPQPEEYIGYYERYIRLVPPDRPLLELLKDHAEETRQLFEGLTEEQAAFRYEPGKWSIKEVLGHIADNELIMSYRLLRIARGDRTILPGYEQDELVPGASFDKTSLQDLLEYYTAARKAAISLFSTVTDAAWDLRGTVNGNILSARALAYIITGHEMHHIQGIRERYLSAL